jgi:hypothetical protein
VRSFPACTRGPNICLTNCNSLVRSAALFSYLENLIMRMAQEADHGSAPAQAKTEYDRMLGVVRQSKDDLVAVGYEEFAVESFYEVYLSPVT